MRYDSETLWPLLNPALTMATQFSSTAEHVFGQSWRYAKGQPQAIPYWRRRWCILGRYCVEPYAIFTSSFSHLPRR